MLGEQFLDNRALFIKIKDLIKYSKNVKIAIAYLTKDGYDEIAPSLEYFLKTRKNNMLEFIVGLSGYGITEPAAVHSLLKLQRSFSGQVRLGYYFNEGFHPKMFIFEQEKEITLAVGSSNLTWQGMNLNVEANVLLSRSKKSPLIKSAQTYFERLMEYANTDLDMRIKEYEKIYKRISSRLKGTSKSSSSVRSPIPRTRLPPQYFESKRTIENLMRKCKILWKISPGMKGSEWDQWIKPDGSGRIAIGWDKENEIGRLDKYRSSEELQRFIDRNRRKWGGSWVERGEKGGLNDPSWYVAQQLWRFYRGTKKGQLVIAYSNKTIFALGKITGGYSYVRDSEYYSHRKEVKWIAVPLLHVDDRNLIKELGLRPTIFFVKSSMVQTILDFVLSH